MRQMLCWAVWLMLVAGPAAASDKSDHSDDSEHSDHAEESEWTDPSDRAALAGIEVAVARPGRVQASVHLHGRILPNEDHLAHVVPRYPGILLEVRKRLGDKVRKGEVLAVVQSNESLQAYSVTSMIDGTVIRKHATPGDYTATGEPIFVVADLRSVWVDLDVYRQDFGVLRVGQRVHLEAGQGIPEVSGEVVYISPFGAANTQTMLARVELPNPDGQWRPGLFVSGRVVLEERQFPVVVPLSALQRIDDEDVVFVRQGKRYRPRHVTLGARDAENVEIVTGLEAGEEYVWRNSFVLKSELGKHAAGHDH